MFPNENEDPPAETPETPETPETEPETPEAKPPEEPAVDPIEKLASDLMANADVVRLAEDPAALLQAAKDPAVFAAMSPEQKAGFAVLVAAARKVSERQVTERKAQADAAAAQAAANQKRTAASLSTLKAFTPTNAVVAEQIKQLEAQVVGNGAVVDPWSDEGIARIEAKAKLEAIRAAFGLMGSVADAEEKRAAEEAEAAAKEARTEEMRAYMLRHPEDFDSRRDVVVEGYDDEGKPIDLRVHMANLMKGGLTMEQAHAKASRHREIGRQLNRKDTPGEQVIQRGGSRKVIEAEPPPGAPFEQWKAWLLRNENALLAKT